MPVLDKYACYPIFKLQSKSFTLNSSRLIHCKINLLMLCIDNLFSFWRCTEKVQNVKQATTNQFICLFILESFHQMFGSLLRSFSYIGTKRLLTRINMVYTILKICLEKGKVWNNSVICKTFHLKCHHFSLMTKQYGKLIIHIMIQCTFILLLINQKLVFKYMTLHQVNHILHKLYMIEILKTP